MSAWLTVIGIGENGIASLSPTARALVECAEVLIGGDRHLAMVEGGAAERVPWPSPLRALLDRIEGWRGRRVVVLATGDPLHYGIGGALVRRFGATSLHVIPAHSAFTLATARLAWPREGVETLTLHGRPIATLSGWLAPGARLVLLANDGDTPRQVAALLVERGFGRSRMVVFEHMGGALERRMETTAARWGRAPAADFNTIALECAGDAGAKVYARVPGLPDEAFRHDGQITKREVRAATLAALQPLPGQRLWDIGAGAGSIAIEWLRAAPGTSAHAIEAEPARVAMIAENAAALGVPGLEIVAGVAPAALANLAPPDAVFIGGGVATPGVLEAAFAALAPGGRLVANAVSVAGESALAAFQRGHGGTLTRIAVARAGAAGDTLLWRALAPVTQLSLVKAHG